MDLTQFHQVFFEESFELLENIEHILLEIDLVQLSDETVDTIFRCAHSIKGSSGTFGFQVVAEFTHIMENYLDKVRKKQKKLNEESVDLLLKSIDYLKLILNKLQSNEAVDESLGKNLIEKFKKLSLTDVVIENQNQDTKIKPINTDNVLLKWEIYFKPCPDLFKSGYDIHKIIKTLEKLGRVQCEAVIEKFPERDNFDPEVCYLSWKIVIETIKSEADIRKDVFEWVESESIINFKKIISDTSNTNISKKNSSLVSLDINKKSKEAMSIRVSTAKIDLLINLVGELIITQSMLTQMVRLEQFNFDQLKEGINKLEQNCRELQENVMGIRMLPISNVFNRFQRMVRDASALLEKNVKLQISGEHTELDKTVLEKISDPLVHLVRNSLDHGIEKEDIRIKAGKNKIGTLFLSARHRGGSVIIEVGDDGSGLNREKIYKKAIENGIIKPNEKISDSQIAQLIFAPGFSTADQVTDMSGRGVGMDVVKKNIESLDGTVNVVTEAGVGTTFTIILPLTLAILDGQLIRIGGQAYIIPLISLKETIKIDINNISKLNSDSEVYYLRNQYIPIIKLSNLFITTDADTRYEKNFLMIIEVEQKLYAIMINELLQQQQFVIKSFEQNYKKIDGIAGATILSNGKVGLILDPAGVVKLEAKRVSSKSDYFKSYA